MKEHIDEMTKVLVDYTKKNHIMASQVILADYAEALYNAGYRKQEWISVDERLPAEDTIVLVWCGEVSVYNYLQNDLWYTGYCDITTSESGTTHWMPLPEAPKMKGGAE